MRDPKHILITGASSGIGAALALLYAGPGIRLSLQGRNPERMGKVAESARQKGADVKIKLCNVTEAATIAAWIESRDITQPIDLVIANAGISAGTGLSQETEAQSRAIFDVNVTGVLNTVHPALPLMIKRKRGQIAIMASLAGFRGLPGAPSYCASKAAVRVYGEGLRNDMAQHNVEVSVICPGFIKTPMTDVNPFPMPFLMSAERAAAIIRARLAKNHGRIAFPWIMARIVELLAAIPPGMTDWMLTKMPRKPPQA